MDERANPRAERARGGALRRADAGLAGPCSSARGARWREESRRPSTAASPGPCTSRAARARASGTWMATSTLDFHNGFSAMVQGHAHPAVVAAVRERVALGTHFGATTEDAVAVAEELARRFGLPRWRFTNSGTEANMAAIRLARALTGPRARGEDGRRLPRPRRDLAPARGRRSTTRRRSSAASRRSEPACVIMEGAMTSVGLVLPEPGYLDAVRELTRRHGVVLILDEVKTGPHDRGRRSRRAARRRAGRRDAREVARRRPPDGRRGHDRGARRAGGGRPPAAARHLQRQPALDGGRGGEPPRGAHARRLRASSSAWARGCWRAASA